MGNQNILKTQKSMSSYTYLLLDGQKVAMEVDPDVIDTVAISLEDGSTIHAVAGVAEEKKLILLQQNIEEEKLIPLMQIRDECAAA